MLGSLCKSDLILSNDIQKQIISSEEIDTNWDISYKTSSEEVLYFKEQEQQGPFFWKIEDQLSVSVPLQGSDPQHTQVLYQTSTAASCTPATVCAKELIELPSGPFGPSRSFGPGRGWALASFDTLASLFVGCLGNGLLALLSHIVQLWWHRWLWRHRWVLLYVATFQILYDQWSFCSWQGGFWHLHCLGQLTQPGHPAVLGIAACIPPWVAESFATLLDSTWHPIRIGPWSTASQWREDPTYRTLCKANWRTILGAGSCAYCTTCNAAGCSAPAIARFLPLRFSPASVAVGLSQLLDLLMHQPFLQLLQLLVPLQPQPQQLLLLHANLHLFALLLAGYIALPLLLQPVLPGLAPATLSFSSPAHPSCASYTILFGASPVASSFPSPFPSPRQTPCLPLCLHPEDHLFHLLHLHLLHLLLPPHLLHHFLPPHLLHSHLLDHFLPPHLLCHFLPPHLLYHFLQQVHFLHLHFLQAPHQRLLLVHELCHLLCRLVPGMQSLL